MDLLQAAKYCKYTPGTIRMYCYTKNFPRHIIDGREVFYKNELDEWLAVNKKYRL